MKSHTEVYGGFSEFLKECPEEKIDKYLSPEKLNEETKESSSSETSSEPSKEGLFRMAVSGVGKKMSVDYDSGKTLDGVESDTPSTLTCYGNS